MRDSTSRQADAASVVASSPQLVARKMMEALDNLTKLVMDNMDAGKLPAWVAGRLIQAIQDRDKEIKRLKDKHILSGYDNDLD